MSLTVEGDIRKLSKILSSDIYLYASLDQFSGRQDKFGQSGQMILSSHMPTVNIWGRTPILIKKSIPCFMTCYKGRFVEVYD